MGGVAPGSPVSAANTNSAFLEKNADDATIGRVGLQNTQPDSGPSITNTQGELNGIDTWTGRPANSGPATLPTWTSNDRGLAINDLKARSEALSTAFNTVTGHKHTGTSQDAPKLDYLNALNGIQLSGFLVQGANLTGVTGSFTNVSTNLSTEAPSTGQAVEGVVTNTPFNVVQLLDQNSNSFEDATGNKVYGRITNTGGVGGTWTLSYFSLISGVETAYSFATSVTVQWFYQKLFNETNRPVYSDQAVIVSDKLAGEIPDATQSVKGQVLLGTATPMPVMATPSVGSGPRVAMEDHAHQGVHSVKSFGGSQLFSDVVFKGTNGTTITQTGQEIDIDSPALLTGSGSITLDQSGPGLGGGQDVPSTSWYEAQRFQFASSQSISKIQVALLKVGTISGNIVVEIRTNSGSSPSNTVVATSQPLNTSALTSSLVLRDFVFSSPVAVSAGTSYWLVVSPAGVTFSGGHYTVGLANNTGGYNSFNAAESGSGGTGGWSIITPFQLQSNIQSSLLSPIAASSAVGSSPSGAHADHTHEGLHSISKSGSSQILGDATLSEGSNVSLVQSGNNIQINVSGFSSSIVTATLNDNQSSPAVLYSTPVSGVRGLKITYGILRGAGKSRASDFWVTTDGTSVSYVDALGTELGLCGITLSADISGGNLRFLYTSTNTGTAGSIKFEAKALPA